MNIFYLDNDVDICAQYHCDRHVTKMIVETAQLLSTAHAMLGTHTEDMYRPTHKNHPCGVWVRSSQGNYEWTIDLLKALIREYDYRYECSDGSKYTRIRDMLPLFESTPLPVNHTEFTEPAQAMPEKFFSSSSLHAYRHYYTIGKAHLHSWRKRKEPEWIHATYS